MRGNLIYVSMTTVPLVARLQRWKYKESEKSCPSQLSNFVLIRIRSWKYEVRRINGSPIHKTHLKVEGRFKLNKLNLTWEVSTSEILRTRRRIPFQVKLISPSRSVQLCSLFAKLPRPGDNEVTVAVEPSNHSKIETIPSTCLAQGHNTAYLLAYLHTTDISH